MTAEALSRPFVVEAFGGLEIDSFVRMSLEPIFGDRRKVKIDGYATVEFGVMLLTTQPECDDWSSKGSTGVMGQHVVFISTVYFLY